MNTKQRYWQIALCLICVLLSWHALMHVDGTEFSGGSVTGTLITLTEIGALGLVIAIAITFFFRRTAAFIAMLGCLFSMPLFLYFLAPGPFRKIFVGNYSVPLQANFSWNLWLILSFAAILTTTILSAWNIRQAKMR